MIELTIYFFQYFKDMALLFSQLHFSEEKLQSYLSLSLCYLFSLIVLRFSSSLILNNMPWSSFFRLFLSVFCQETVEHLESVYLQFSSNMEKNNQYFFKYFSCSPPTTHFQDLQSLANLPHSTDMFISVFSLCSILGSFFCYVFKVTSVCL